MGYIITFKFQEKEAVEDSSQETELKTKVIHIGKPEEDTDPRRVAATIIQQYADPNAWIQDVIVEQWAKTKIKFSQTKTGVKIGGQSFNLGLNEIMKLAVSDQPAPKPVSIQPQSQQQASLHPHEVVYQTPPRVDPVLTYSETNNQFIVPETKVTQTTSSGKPIAPTLYAKRYEVLDPHIDLKYKLNGQKLTLGKKYLIISEHPNPAGVARGMAYKIQDDTGREMLLDSQCFRPEQILPVDDSRVRELQPQLSYESQLDYSVPDLRSRSLPSQSNMSRIAQDSNDIISRVDRAITNTRGR